MMPFLKQRWVLVLLAVGGTLLFIYYLYPKLKKSAAGTSAVIPATPGPGSAAGTDNVVTPAGALQRSLGSRLSGPVKATMN